ncbi:Peptidyl-prolyl cis-trans isomerase CYP21-4 [Camellia lanceoleosa]|uniref:Peptidyl-prolyl cis-trans isomerase CYP21-4 n=1 Tax=Camellia lanceoleosa TaxID=1840588 RepID=A0ACC0F6L6_9ERIC|nr:Peptidyl-prolyl cis-trans isomerase CYP21-4 [Camellia lanceoleosa]
MSESRDNDDKQGKMMKELDVQQEEQVSTEGNASSSTPLEETPQTEGSADKMTEKPSGEGNVDLPFHKLTTHDDDDTISQSKSGSIIQTEHRLSVIERGHFKGMPFHHVIKNFVIQGGNSDIPGATDDWTLKVKHNSQLETRFALLLTQPIKHEAFMLGTTKAKHDKEGFELFITIAPIPDLNEKLIVFGRVIKGEDVVQVDTDEHYRPKSPIGIINVTLKEKFDYLHMARLLLDLVIYKHNSAPIVGDIGQYKAELRARGELKRK